VLAAPLASPLARKAPSIGQWPTLTAVRNPAEKADTAWLAVDGSDVEPLTMRVSTAAVDVAYKCSTSGSTSTSTTR
jgi:hypothetical protein